MGPFFTTPGEIIILRSSAEVRWISLARHGFSGSDTEQPLFDPWMLDC